MKKTRKRLFAFSGLVVLVAQVLVMALCSIPAIAVTREETNRTLFNNEHGSATISYEEMESGGLNWTINLQKAVHDTATRFMVAMTADGQAIMPENVQTVMQSTPEISFTAGNGEGLMLAGLQEGAAGSGAGSAVITYQTSGNYGQMAVVPKLVTVGDTVSDLLAGNPGVVYDIPVKEEPVATEEAVTGELPLTEEQTATTEATEAEVVESTIDSQVGEVAESTTESTVADEATEATQVTESTEVEATETTESSESSEAVVEGEATESTTEDSTATTESSSEAEDETEAADEEDNSVVLSEIPDITTGITSLGFEKTWNFPDDVDPKTMDPKPSIVVQVKDGEGNVVREGTLTYPNTHLEWNNLPLYDETTGEEIEYTVEEKKSPEFVASKTTYTESEIDSDFTYIPNNSTTDWGVKPTFVITRLNQSLDGRMVIWTLNHVDPADRVEFLQNVYEKSGDGRKQPLKDLEYDLLFSDDEAVQQAYVDSMIWMEGPQISESVSDEGSININVTFNEDGSVKDSSMSFSGKNVWTQFVTGGYTTRQAAITNTYVEPKTITVKKIWDDQNNLFSKRQDVDLILQQSNDDGATWNPVAPEQKLHVSAGAEGNEVSGDFKLPAKGLNAAGNIVTLKYRVVEELADGSGVAVPDYEKPVYNPTNDKNENIGISEAGTLTVTNKLITTDLAFTKVKSNGDSLDGVTFVVTQDGTAIGEVESGEDGTPGHVSFKGLAVGNYTLTEVATVNGYEIDGPWNFTVNADKSITWTGENPFDENGNIVNNLKPFDLTVKKVNENDEELLGATFELSGGDLEEPIEVSGGPEFNFTDLKPGMSYTLTETHAPDGYAKLLNPITITINEDGTVTIKGDDASGLKWHSDVVDGHNTISFNVTNKALVPLPATGGPGTLLFFVMGILAIAVTGIYFVSRQKQEVA